MEKQDELTVIDSLLFHSVCQGTAVNLGWFGFVGEEEHMLIRFHWFAALQKLLKAFRNSNFIDLTLIKVFNI